ncbi:MAG: chromosome segregation protein SMC [Rhodospirillales bacterium]|nr:chromosome segregation protein SMC [Rhodospirillales bacterium]
MQFTKLRLSGFKSFVDHTEFHIEDGLTGVVGPNGCGKSNLVEAMRWVMGETSAKQMRGGEMDDVIFGGTRNRPPRNVAEVVLHLDNDGHSAPAQFNDLTELEISRRIEREKGSNYRVNGQDVRARDVQLLFADAASGARSTAMVSQGRIGAIIAAKPTQRRSLLEEAAGIKGLHSRRHEAELRLRGAEGNLARLEDVLVTMDAQLSGLRKQARQATRYRNLSEHIRTAEAALYLLRWNEAIDRLDVAREAFKEAEAKVVQLTGSAGEATTRQVEAASSLPELRKAGAEASARLQRLLLERETLDAETGRIETAKQECLRRIEQIATDMEREKRLVEDADGFVAKLEEERQTMEADQDGAQSRAEESAERLELINGDVEELQSRLEELTDAVAAGEARRVDLERRVSELTDRKQRTSDRLEEARTQYGALELKAVGERALAEAEAAMGAAEEVLENARDAVEQAEAARVQATSRAGEAVSSFQETQAVLTKLQAEEEALSELLASTGQDQWPPVVDLLTVDPGFETALGAALGEDLSASTDKDAPLHWLPMSSSQQRANLPDGVKPLTQYVSGSNLLKNRLSQIGIVVSSEEGDRLCEYLSQGQRLVSKDGGLWRWDGLTMAPGAPTPAAIRLEQRNRLNALRGKIENAERDVEARQAQLEEIRELEADSVEEEHMARESVRVADGAYAQAWEARMELRQRASEQATRLASVLENVERLTAEVEEAAIQVEEAKTAFDSLSEPGTGREKVAQVRAELAENRAKQLELQSAHDNLIREAELRQRRFASIADELQSWQERKAAAQRHMEDREDRRESAQEELLTLEARPTQIAEQRKALLITIEEAEQRRNETADRLAVDEKRLADAELELREHQSVLAEAREERVRLEAAVTQGQEACRNIAERISENLDCKPDEVGEIAGFAEEAELPPLDQIEKRFERLQRERDNMGPVNLRAEAEATELGEQMDTMESQRADLLKAIDKLRRGIAELNREGRQRLLTSFKEVDLHFQELFVRLFGGGRAHLELTESDDPLNAGLEIMASPPGKRLQILSLLSGGEQALTALALLFGVFMTNPAPICVLDEVDAPLDDANVDRFCTLLSEMSQSASTRFMVITHHRMTMARMDRLFGVTMSERGVSQLVSVDLRKAEELTVSV